jgi:tetratricopeptide (TPR) repeat protein
VSRAGYTVVRLTDVESPYDAPNNARWHMLRRELGIEAFGINAWTSREAGQSVIGEHDETGNGHEELYVVLSGRATFTIDGETHDAPQGTAVFVRDPAVKRSAVGDVPDTTILVVGAKRGEAYAVSQWESAAEALRFWHTEEWDKAIEALEAELAKDPEQAVINYNLACAESRAGKTDDALRHLERAISLQPSIAEMAKTDPDLDGIREHTGFPV